MKPAHPSFKKQITLYLSATFGLVLVVLVVLMANHAAGRKKSGPPQFPPLSVVAAKVLQTSVPRYIQAVGQCTAFESVEIVPQVDGKITQVYHKNGGWVKKGELLFEIEPEIYQAALKKAEAQLAIDQARLTLHHSQLERSQVLRSGDFVSQQEYDGYKANVEEFKARVALDEANRDIARIDCERCTVRAQFDGKLSVPSKQAGDIIEKSSMGDGSNVLTTLRRLNRLYVDFSLAETYLQTVLEAWQKQSIVHAEVRLLDKPDIRALGQLVFVDNTIDKQTGNFQARIELNNEKLLLWPGSSVEIKLYLEQIKRANLVPEGAIQISQQGPYVFLVSKESKAEMRPVVPGQTHQDWVVIERGLEGGEVVVAEGNVMLAPETSVKVKEMIEAPAL